MKLGAFSISLTVKDLAKSKEFYEKLGFTVFAGDMAMKYLIMKNESSCIGLFEGMFDKNILTFNPGWDESARKLDDFTDVRQIQEKLKQDGLSLIRTVDEDGAGPGSITLIDPDGNPILIDQHV